MDWPLVSGRALLIRVMGGARKTGRREDGKTGRALFPWLSLLPGSLHLQRPQFPSGDPLHTPPPALCSPWLVSHLFILSFY